MTLEEAIIGLIGRYNSKIESADKAYGKEGMSDIAKALFAGEITAYSDIVADLKMLGKRVKSDSENAEEKQEPLCDRIRFTGENAEKVEKWAKRISKGNARVYRNLTIAWDGILQDSGKSFSLNIPQGSSVSFKNGKFEGDVFVPYYDERDDWISVKDRLPEMGKSVLTVISDENGTRVRMGYTDCTSKWRRMDGGDMRGYEVVTHWRPLPKPPKSEEK